MTGFCFRASCASSAVYDPVETSRAAGTTCRGMVEAEGGGERGWLRRRKEEREKVLEKYLIFGSGNLDVRG